MNKSGAPHRVFERMEYPRISQNQQPVESQIVGVPGGFSVPVGLPSLALPSGSPLPTMRDRDNFLSIEGIPWHAIFCDLLGDERLNRSFASPRKQGAPPDRA